MDFDISKVVFGLRHRRLFKFLSSSGSIIDELIALQGSGDFPEECFNRISWSPDGQEFKLHDDEDTFSVVANYDGIIFTCDMEAEPRLKPGQIQGAFKTVAKKVLPISGGNKSLNRIGIINFYRIEESGNAAKRIYDEIFKLPMTGTPDDLRLRLAMKYPTQSGVVRGDINDYKNAIFQIRSRRESKDATSPPDVIDFSIDYQIYYQPERTYSDHLVEQHYGEFETYIARLKETNLTKLLPPGTGNG